jgi:hypothetical protein
MHRHGKGLPTGLPDGLVSELHDWVHASRFVFPDPELATLDADVGKRAVATFVAPSEVVEQDRITTHVFKVA